MDAYIDIKFKQFSLLCLLTILSESIVSMQNVNIFDKGLTITNIASALLVSGSFGRSKTHFK